MFRSKILYCSIRMNNYSGLNALEALPFHILPATCEECADYGDVLAVSALLNASATPPSGAGGLNMSGNPLPSPSE